MWHIRPTFNQELNGNIFRFEKLPLGSNIGGQRSTWSKIDNGRIALNEPLGVILRVKCPPVIEKAILMDFDTPR
jgi:hypothetical protein